MSIVEVVTTPTFDWLADRISSCTSRVLIGSPFVNDGILSLTSLVSRNVPRILITRTDLRDFAMGASNPGTLCKLATDGVDVRSLIDLHAKIYVFDDKWALVTSANATNSGMRRNIECGLATQDRRVVNRLARSLLRGLGAESPPRRMKLEKLEALQAQTKMVKATVLLPKVTAPLGDSVEAEATFSIADPRAFLQSDSGWLRLTLQGVLAMPEENFQLQQLISECQAEASRRYPKNQNVEAKLRQQLQVLRDKGIVEFLAPDQPGHYRRTMS